MQILPTHGVSCLVVWNLSWVHVLSRHVGCLSVGDIFFVEPSQETCRLLIIPVFRQYPHVPSFLGGGVFVVDKMSERRLRLLFSGQPHPGVVW